MRSRSAVRVVLVVAGMVWAGRRLRHTYFFYDEWSMVGRVVHYDVVEGMSTHFNGHLWMLQDLIYRIQVHQFGMDHHWFVVAMFLGSLAGLHLVLGAVFERIGVTVVPATLLGGALTYLGAASQNFIFAIQVSPTLAMAASIAPAVAIVGRSPSRPRMIAVVLVTLLGVASDSAFGLVGVAFTAVLLVREWSVRHLALLAPSAAVLGIWYGFADLGPELYPSGPGQQLAFAPRLLARSAGALFGGGPAVGVVVLVGAGVLVAVTAWWVPVERARRSLSLAGAAATIVIVAGISRNRAGIPEMPWREFNRYFQNVGIPLGLTFVPLLLSVVDHVAGCVRERHWPTERHRRWIGSGAVVIVFGLGLPAEADYASDFVAWNRQVRSQLDGAVSLAARGCPPGAELDPAARPLGALNPQIQVQFLVELVDRGLLAPDPALAPEPVVTERMCRTPTADGFGSGR